MGMSIYSIPPSPPTPDPRTHRNSSTQTTTETQIERLISQRTQDFYILRQDPSTSQVAMEQDAVTASIYLNQDHCTIWRNILGYVTHFVTHRNEDKEIDICYFLIGLQDHPFPVACVPGAANFTTPLIHELPPGCYAIVEPFDVSVTVLIRKPVFTNNWVHCARDVKILTRTNETDLVDHAALFEDLFESEPES